ncbi:COG4223 family protein [Pseudaminobacter sp. NGMCC 1.201702]|uniref:COG4223 family protein n=1 Tax=Pseudaminobacter sp. NGMCC 1.201702 TaxID=3391825 RepID=UPI0039F08CD3
MVKTPKMRHSKPHRDPVTIDLEPGAVSRVSGTEARTEADTEEQADFDRTATSDAASPEDIATETSTAKTESGSEQPEPSGYDFSADSAANNSSGGEPQPVTRPEETARKADSRPSGLSMLAAGLAGGLVALAGAGALQFAGILPTAGSNGTSALEPVQAEVAQMRQDLVTLRDNAGGSDAGLTGRVDALGQSVEQVKTDLAGLQQALSSADSGDAGGNEALNGRIDEIEKSIAALRQQNNQTEAADIGAINERIAEAEALAKTASDAMTAANSRVAALEQSLNSMSKTVEAQAAQPKIALAIAVSALKSATERGGPFQAELETFAAIAPDAPEIAALRPYAEEGVPSLDDILAESDAAVKAMIAASRPVDEQAGFFDRLLTSAESLVTVRPIGAVEGTGVPETAARMELAAKAGNLEEALAEYDSLPETVRAAGSEFAGKMRARLEVKKLVDQAIADAMKS